jgi:hypothetical protein
MEKSLSNKTKKRNRIRKRDRKNNNNDNNNDNVFSIFDPISTIIPAIIPNVPEQNNDNIIENVKKMTILMYSRDSCPNCSRLKSEAVSCGIDKFIKIIDSDSDAGSALWSLKNLPSNPILPIYTNTKNEKVHCGYAPIGNVINSLI